MKPQQHWRERNKEHYSDYMREYMADYRKKIAIKCKTHYRYGSRKLERKDRNTVVTIRRENITITF